MDYPLDLDYCAVLPVGVASLGSEASAFWELLSFFHISQKYIFWHFSVQKDPNSKIIAHFFYINDPF